MLFDAGQWSVRPCNCHCADASGERAENGGQEKPCRVARPGRTDSLRRRGNLPLATAAQRPRNRFHLKDFMKFASLNDGSLDGQLLVVSRDLSLAVSATALLPT
jgi:hypothetical protein